MSKRIHFATILPLISLAWATSAPQICCAAAEMLSEEPGLRDFSAVDLQIIKEARNLGEKASEIWPSFNFRDLPILLHAEHSELLFDHPETPEGFARSIDL